MRSRRQRQSDAQARLRTDADVWVATAAPGGRAHLVPLSLCWDGSQVVVAVERSSRTARNAEESAYGRLAVGSSRDVVMIDAPAVVVSAGSAPADLVASYQARVGWDPSGEPGEWVYVCFTPDRIQVWNSLEEMAGRTVLRDGAWLPEIQDRI